MRPKIAFLTCLALASCGRPEQVENSQAQSIPGAAEIDCSGAKAQTVPAGSPADDVLGLRAGMSLEDARLLLKCTNKAFRFEERRDGFQLPEMPDGRFAITHLVARRGEIAGCDPADSSTLQTCLAEDPSFTRVDEVVGLFLAGVPGQEKVIAVTRELSFPEGGEQASDAITTGLTGKYGAEPGAQAVSSTTRLYWVFDDRGRRMSSANPDFTECAQTVGTGSGAPNRLRDGCRLTINGWIEATSDNPQLVRAVGTVVVDQQAALDALAQAKEGIRAAHEATRQREVDDAKARGGTATVTRRRICRIVLIAASWLSACNQVSNDPITANQAQLTQAGQPIAPQPSPAVARPQQDVPLRPNGTTIENPDGEMIAFLYHSFASGAPIDAWVASDVAASRPDEFAKEELIRQRRGQLQQIAEAAAKVGRLSLPVQSELSEYDKLYGEYYIGLFSGRAVLSFAYRDRRYRLEFVNKTEAQPWKIRPDEAEHVFERNGRSRSIVVTPTVEIVGFSPSTEGGTLKLKVLSYVVDGGINETRLGKVEVGETKS